MGRAGQAPAHAPPLLRDAPPPLLWPAEPDVIAGARSARGERLGPRLRAPAPAPSPPAAALSARSGCPAAARVKAQVGAPQQHQQHPPRRGEPGGAKPVRPPRFPRAAWDPAASERRERAGAGQAGQGMTARRSRRRSRGRCPWWLCGWLALCCCCPAAQSVDAAARPPQCREVRVARGGRCSGCASCPGRAGSAGSAAWPAGGRAARLRGPRCSPPRPPLSAFASERVGFGGATTKGRLPPPGGSALRSGPEKGGPLRAPSCRPWSRGEERQVRARLRPDRSGEARALRPERGHP